MSDVLMDVGAGPRLPRPGRGVTIVLLSAIAAALLATSATIAIGTIFPVRGGVVVSASPPAPVPEWIDVPRPVQIFSLQAPMLGRAPPVYSARRRSDGEGREDIMVFGAPGASDAPSLRLRLTRRAHAPGTPAPPLFAAIARQASEAGFSVERAGLANLLTTRFGRFEIADVTLSDGISRRVPCSGFRLVVPDPALTTTGLVCGASGEPVDPASLACLIDRLDLASGGEDRALVDFFAKSELRRDPTCGGARLAPDGLHAAWLDDKPATPRKTSRRR